jgi:L-aminopeptidase/D-esterase-like protein
MIRTGKRNLITDVPGILVGNAEDATINTGASVVVPVKAAVAAVDVRGGAPGTRETELLRPTCLVERIDAICLSGGSAFGLDAASGVMDWLKAQGRGFPVAGFRVPLVPSAIIFDLNNGGDKQWGDMPPYRDLGRKAAAAAGEHFRLGRAGAGFGARAGALPGGLGSASCVTADGITIGALVAANPVGSVMMPGTDTPWAWALELQNECGGLAPPAKKPDAAENPLIGSKLGGHTTIGVVATDAELTKSEAERVAIMAHDGLARAIRPVHTPFDGDTIFVLATGCQALPPDRALALTVLGALAADCVARAIMRAVFEARNS